MKQEDKDLLLKDLCARLPYCVKLWHESYIFNLTLHAIDSTQFAVDVSNNNLNNNRSWWNSIEQVKPYLFPLSSMTEEQKIKYENLCVKVEECEGSHYGFCDRDCLNISYEDTYHSIDWLNANHFDYRGLIEKELAIDATGLNIY